MKNVSILVPQGQISLVNIEGSHQILSQVNSFMKMKGKPAIFNIQLVGITKPTRLTSGQYVINIDKLIEEVEHSDLIIIPAVHGNQEEVLMNNKAFIPWIIKQHSMGAEIASFCIGAYFLAATGLLEGKQCATHWLHINDFRKMYPEVNAVDDKIMTEEDGIYTSGGAYSYLNLLMYLIEKYAGREIAILTSKAFMIDINRHSQSPFIMFQGQKTHEDVGIKKVQEYIEKNYMNRITVEELANTMAVGRRSLERRFKKATGNTISEYIQRVKVEAAKKSLENSRKNVSEVMYEVGYADTKAFRTVFKKITSLSPVEYRNRYSKEAVSLAV